MSDAPLCPECGAPLPTDAAADAPCPACLMKLGLDSWTARQGDSNGPPATEIYQPFHAPKPEELNDRFDGVEILDLLGQGGMGAVYKARQQSLDRIVALKIIKPTASEDPGFAERFAREARSLARLNHPNILTIHDFGESDGLYWFMMEFVDGVNLRQAMRAGKMSPAEAIAIVPQICDALQYAHDEGIVHRDIKPENVLIDSRGRVKIADFGLAKLLRRTPVEVTLTNTHQVMGTLNYMAPEQMETPATVDHRADIYSLGVVFYELLTGELPRGRFQLPSQKTAVDARLDDVVLKTLEHAPDRRYQHASEVKTEVEAISSSPIKPSMAARASLEKPQRPETISSSQSASIGLLIAACVGLAVVGLVAILAVIGASYFFGFAPLLILILSLAALAIVVLVVLGAAVFMAGTTNKKDTSRGSKHDDIAMKQPELDAIEARLQWPAFGLRISGILALLPLLAVIVLTFMILALRYIPH